MPCATRHLTGFPLFVNFPGIDGVLGNGQNIYALQVIITDTHRRADARLKKAWEAIGAVSALFYSWHFVMITDKQGLTEKYVNLKKLGTRCSSGFWSFVKVPRI